MSFPSHEEGTLKRPRWTESWIHYGDMTVRLDNSQGKGETVPGVTVKSPGLPGRYCKEVYPPESKTTYHSWNEKYINITNNVWVTIEKVRVINKSFTYLKFFCDPSWHCRFYCQFIIVLNGAQWTQEMINESETSFILIDAFVLCENNIHLDYVKLRY